MRVGLRSAEAHHAGDFCQALVRSEVGLSRVASGARWPLKVVGFACGLRSEAAPAKVVLGWDFFLGRGGGLRLV